jgi:acyl dehydratase
MTEQLVPNADTNLYLEDLHVGRRFTSGEYSIDERQIKEFAAAFDPQPFHLDDVAASKSIFGGLVASGWHTAAVSMRLNVASLPIAGGILGLGGELTWPKPVRPGDVLRVESEVVEVIPSHSRPDRGIVVMRIETRNGRNEVVQVTTVKLLVPRRESAQRSP